MSVTNGELQQVGLIGWPVSHSVSPAMFNTAFTALGLNWRYNVYPAPPDALSQILKDLRAKGVRGLNVTVPHKRAVMAFVDAVNPEAKAIGAVNTITIAGSADSPKWYGMNTDIKGFQDDLAAALDPVVDRTPRALILGSGGSARAVAYVLAQLGYQITVAARNASQGLELIRDVQSGVAAPAQAPSDLLTTQWRMKMVAIPWNKITDAARRCYLIINCTPVGMWPAINDSPWPEDVPIPATAVVYDLVYRPAKTRLMQQAEAAGTRAIGGLGMLVRQGAASFRLWTGQEPPLDRMAEAARKALDS